MSERWPYLLLVVHAVACVWTTWNARRGAVASSIAVMVWMTMALNVARRFLLCDGAVFDIAATPLAPYFDQAIFCAFAPIGYVCARFEYRGRILCKETAIAVAMTIAMSALSLRVDETASKTLLSIQQSFWAVGILLVLWDAGLRRHGRDLTMALYGFVAIELIISALYGLDKPDDYIVAQVLSLLLHAGLPLTSFWVQAPRPT